MSRDLPQSAEGSLEDIACQLTRIADALEAQAKPTMVFNLPGDLSSKDTVALAEAWSRYLKAEAVR